MIALVALVLAGTIPSSLPSPSRVVWIASTGDIQDAACTLAPANRWTCEQVSGDARGLIVIIDASGALAYVLAGVDGPLGDRPHLWGRVVQAAAGGAAPDDLHGLEARVWKPSRPPFRPRTERFVPVEASDVHVVQLSDTTFWVAALGTEEDAHLEITGPSVATSRTPLARLAGGPIDVPVVLPLATPSSLDGRVQTARGMDVEGADVELFQPLTPPPGTPADTSGAIIRIAATRSAADGSFTFDRMEPGTYRIAVVHPSLGRGTVTVRSLADPLVVTLVPPVQAIGRVLKNGLPLAHARVRFVPDASRLMATTDITTLLAPETTTGPDGAFSLALPPDATGDVQVVGPDGSSMRRLLARRADRGQILLGDLNLPEPRRLIIRLIDSASCTLEALGPVGRVSLAIVRATHIGQVYWFDLPEAGEWALQAECAGESYAVQPEVAVVSPRVSETMLDVSLVR